jgi:hypothetical protein
MPFVATSSRGLLQPAVKCRGREYLRMIYGPEYTLPEHLERLRERGLSGKRSLALRKFALGIEGLERVVPGTTYVFVSNHQSMVDILAVFSTPATAASRVYEIEIDNAGDAQEHVTFQFQFWETPRHIALPIGPPGNQVTNEIPLVVAGQIFATNNAALNVVENYSVKIITGNRRTGVAQYLTNAVDGSIVFTKPVDNIGNKTLPDYDSYANSYMYTVSIPGCPIPGRLFVGQRKDPFVVNLGETFDLINFSNPLGPVDGDADRIARAWRNEASASASLP